MKVFIAGATMAGFFYEEKSQHLNTEVSRLSQSPFASFAMVLADSGAISIADASFLSSMCNTASSLFVQDAHSSSSLNTRRCGFDRSESAVKSVVISEARLYSSPHYSTKCKLFLVGMRTTLKPLASNS